MNLRDIAGRSCADRGLFRCVLLAPTTAALSDPISRPRSSRRAGTRSSTGSATRPSRSSQGAPKANGFLVPRQTNEFYYLCGIETPHAYLVLDGRDRKVTLFLPRATRGWRVPRARSSPPTTPSW